MNRAIRELERETVKVAGPDADRFLDDIGNLIGSNEGISSKRNVSFLKIVMFWLFILPVIFKCGVF